MNPNLTRKQWNKLTAAILTLRQFADRFDTLAEDCKGIEEFVQPKELHEFADDIEKYIGPKE